MGEKGAKLTQLSNEMAKLFVDRLSSLEGISCRKMFGGNGIFHDKKMFGIVTSKGECFLKTNEATKESYEKKGSTKHSRMSYHSIPDDVLNDDDELVMWVKKAIEISKS